MDELLNGIARALQSVSKNGVFEDMADMGAATLSVSIEDIDGKPKSALVLIQGECTGRVLQAVEEATK